VAVPRGLGLRIAKITKACQAKAGQEAACMGGEMGSEICEPCACSMDHLIQ
jgi:hypothetical protein